MLLSLFRYTIALVLRALVSSIYLTFNKFILQSFLYNDLVYVDMMRLRYSRVKYRNRQLTFPSSTFNTDIRKRYQSRRDKHLSSVVV